MLPFKSDGCLLPLQLLTWLPSRAALKLTPVNPQPRRRSPDLAQHPEDNTIVDGSTAEATLEEPLGISFVGSSLYICCFRTGLKLCSHTVFALRHCQEVQKVYIAIGFKPKTSKEILPKHSFTESLELMSQGLSFMQSIYSFNRNKSQLLDKEYISTEHGRLYPPTIKCSCYQRGFRDSRRQLKVLRKTI